MRAVAATVGVCEAGGVQRLLAAAGAASGREIGFCLAGAHGGLLLMTDYGPRRSGQRADS